MKPDWKVDNVERYDFQLYKKSDYPEQDYVTSVIPLFKAVWKGYYSS